MRFFLWISCVFKWQGFTARVYEALREDCVGRLIEYAIKTADTILLPALGKDECDNAAKEDLVNLRIEEFFSRVDKFRFVFSENDVLLCKSMLLWCLHVVYKAGGTSCANKLSCLIIRCMGKILPNEIFSFQKQCWQTNRLFQNEIYKISGFEDCGEMRPNFSILHLAVLHSKDVEPIRELTKWVGNYWTQIDMSENCLMQAALRRDDLCYDVLMVLADGLRLGERERLLALKDSNGQTLKENPRNEVMRFVATVCAINEKEILSTEVPNIVSHVRNDNRL